MSGGPRPGWLVGPTPGREGDGKGELDEVPSNVTGSKVLGRRRGAPPPRGREFGFLPSEPGRRHRTLGLVCSLFFFLVVFPPLFFSWLYLDPAKKHCTKEMTCASGFFSCRHLSGCRNLACWVGFFPVPDPPLREFLLSLKSSPSSAGPAGETFAKGSAGLGAPCHHCAGPRHPRAGSFASQQPAPRHPALRRVISVASSCFRAAKAKEEAGGCSQPVPRVGLRARISPNPCSAESGKEGLPEPAGQRSGAKAGRRVRSHAGELSG